MKLDSELQAVVERAREHAREGGELLTRPWAPSEDPLPEAACEALRGWVASGGYDRAVAKIVADDPDFQTQQQVRSTALVVDDQLLSSSSARAM